MKIIKVLTLSSAIFSGMLLSSAYGLDLNKATYQELLSLPGISKFQAYKINEYREIFGYYRSLNELLKVEGVGQEDVQAWQSSLVITIPETTIKPKVSVRLKDQQVRGAGGGNFQSLHMKVKDLYRCWSAGLLVEGYRHYIEYDIDGSHAMNGEWDPTPRLNKFYLSWTPHGVIDSIYFGDYLAGFGEGVVMDISGRSKPQGLYPGDTPAMEYDTAKISDHSLLNGISHRSTKSFRGVAAVLDQTYIKETILYSNKNNSYYGFYVEDDPLRKPLEDYFSEQVTGLDVTGFVLGETEVGVTSYYSTRNVKGPDPWRYPAGNKDFLVYGAHGSTYLGRFNLCGELGKVKDHGQALFVESSSNFANLNVSASFRQYDIDYTNPHAGVYSIHYPQSVFRCRDEKGVLLKMKWQVFSMFGLNAFFDQYIHQYQAYWNKSKGDYAISAGKKETDRESGIESKAVVMKKVIINTGIRYKDNNIYQNSGSEKINISNKVTYVPNEKIETSVKYYIRHYIYQSADYSPYDYMTVALSYQVARACEVEGTVKYANIFVYQNSSGIGEYTVGCHYKINDEIKMNISYTAMPPLAKNSSYEFEEEADLLPYADAYYQDKLVAEVVFHW